MHPTRKCIPLEHTTIRRDTVVPADSNSNIDDHNARKGVVKAPNTISKRQRAMLSILRRKELIFLKVYDPYTFTISYTLPFVQLVF
jgi:hypothetical protein